MTAEIAATALSEKMELPGTLSPEGETGFGEDICGEDKQEGFYTRRAFSSFTRARLHSLQANAPCLRCQRITFPMHC